MTKEDWSAYTLIEMLLVLLIASFFALFPVIRGSSWVHQQEVDYYFSALEQHLYMAQVSAVSSGYKSWVYLDNQTNLMQFIYRDSRGKIVNLDFPAVPGVTIVNSLSLSFANHSGSVNKITALTFKTDAKPRQVTYQYYIGSGRFEKKTR